MPEPDQEKDSIPQIVQIIPANPGWMVTTTNPVNSGGRLYSGKEVAAWALCSDGTVRPLVANSDVVELNLMHLWPQEPEKRDWETFIEEPSLWSYRITDGLPPDDGDYQYVGSHGESVIWKTMTRRCP